MGYSPPSAPSMPSVGSYDPPSVADVKGSAGYHPPNVLSPQQFHSSSSMMYRRVRMMGDMKVMTTGKGIRYSVKVIDRGRVSENKGKFRSTTSLPGQSRGQQRFTMR